jgi:hypothetical protein
MSLSSGTPPRHEVAGGGQEPEPETAEDEDEYEDQYE